MKNMDKLLLVIYILTAIILSIFCIVLPFDVIPGISLNSIFNDLNDSNRWYYIIGIVIFLFWSIYLLFALFKGENKKSFGIVKYTSEGEINISNETIRSLVMKTIGQIKGVKESKVFINPGTDKVNILVKTLVMPDINIPNTVKEIQESVRQYIELIAEVPVGEIKVIIVDVASGTRLRLE